MSLRWQYCRIRERFSSGPAERGGPAWWVELALDAEASAPAWSRLAAQLLEALAADQQPAVAEALDLGDDPEPSTPSRWCLLLARALLAPWPVEELPPQMQRDLNAALDALAARVSCEDGVAVEVVAMGDDTDADFPAIYGDLFEEQTFDPANGGWRYDVQPSYGLPDFSDGQ